MIKLRLLRLKRRPTAMPQSGVEQSIYRVLCIAMIAEPEESEQPALFSAAKVTHFGFDSAELNALYAFHKTPIYHWARGKDILIHSDHVDANGRQRRPAMWTKKNWQDRVADQLWNRAVDIVDEACDLHERDGRDGDTYWYSVSKGVYFYFVTCAMVCRGSTSGCASRIIKIGNKLEK